MLLQMAKFCFFYGWVAFHIFYIHSSVYGHFSCFQNLAIVNNAAKNTAENVSFWINVLIFFRYIPRIEIAGLYGSSSFSFWGTSILPSIVAVPVYNPTKRVLGLPFLDILANLWYLCYFDDSHSDSEMWYLIVVSIFISLIIRNVEHFFSCVFWPPAFPLWENVYFLLFIWGVGVAPAACIISRAKDQTQAIAVTTLDP